MDPVLQAYTGLMAENRGEDGVPHRVPVIVVDMSTALYAFQGAVGRTLCPARRAARPLHRRQPDAGGDGAAVDPPDGLHLEGGAMKPGGVPGGVFQTADGWMSILALQRPRLAEPLPGDGHAGAGRRSALRLARACGSPTTWRSTPSSGRRLPRAPSAEWSKRLTEARLMHERLNSYARFPRPAACEGKRPDPVAAQAGLDRPVPVPALPGMLPQADGTPRGTAPVPGQHTREILVRTRLRRRGNRRPARPRRRRRRMITTARSRAATAVRRGRMAAASPSTSPSRMTSGASAARRSRRPAPSPTMPASIGCRSSSPAAASCSTRPTARSTCGRRSSRCASPARRRSSAASKPDRSRS